MRLGGAKTVRRTIGGTFVKLHGLCSRAVGKGFSLLVAGAFSSFGRRTVLQPPIRLSGADRIAVGDDVFIGSGSWLQVIGEGDSVAVEIGDGTSMVGSCTVSAVEAISVGKKVLMARNV